MLNVIAKKLFGTQNDRQLKTIQPLVDKINGLEPEIKALTDDQLRAKTEEFKKRIQDGERTDAILPEAFAVVREAAWRVLGQRHYDVQLIGGIILHKGTIAEMKTGEGKTLVSTLPAYLNALTGKGVHIVTVNDYLAQRDSAWMGSIHKFLGLKVGVIVHGISDEQRQEAYNADITYGTNSEFGFDYLRDNMKFAIEDYVQRPLHYAIVDEVDSILIDEARTPLIISGPTEDSTDKYYTINAIIPKLDKKHYTTEEKTKTAALTDEGVEKVQQLLGTKNLYDPRNIEVIHHVNQALKAHTLFKKDVDYVVKDGQVHIVDEFTGRLMEGRRWSDGLHQAVEAKEGVRIENENQTLATITYQNYFRMYEKLAGMTGTADTEATEFKKIYKLNVSVIPTNRPIARKDHADVIYKGLKGKYQAIANDIKEHHGRGQPILVGTVSIENSEIISNLLRKERIPHNVLNAKHHLKEAEIVAQAGKKGSVTIATNMAGRGTDIVLGGNPEALAKQKVDPDENPEEYEKVFEKYKTECEAEKKEVLEAGGLFIIGTERHESRRIDNQLRGRSGRQGDPGESRFYLSLEDDLMRIFGSVNIARFMDEDMPIEHKWITRAIENAQKKVEAHNFDIRKHLLEYDDVMNQQRNVVYTMRKEILRGEDLKSRALGMVDQVAESIANDFYFSKKAKANSNGNGADVEEADDQLKTLNEAATMSFHTPVSIDKETYTTAESPDKLAQAIIAQVEKAYDAKEADVGSDTMRHLEKMICLSTIDSLWKDHLLAMDHLREGIGLRGYAQKDPLLEYKKEGFSYFEVMYNQIAFDIVQKLFAVQVEQEEDVELMAPREQQQMTFSHGDAQGPTEPIKSDRKNEDGSKVGRNDPCPCGSGKKYKKCHGR